MPQEIDPPINTSIPLALNPRVLEAVGPDHQLDPVVGIARNALAAAHASFSSTLDGHAAILADVTHTEAANLQRSATAAARRQQQALQRIDGAVDRLRQEIQNIDDSLNTPSDPPPAQITAMVANALRSMPPKQRSEAIAEAIETKDSATIAALFVGPAYAFGLSKVERDMYKHQYLQATFPTALARRAALERTIELLNGAGQSLITANSRLFDKKKLDDAAARAKAAEEALQ